jgi:spermidine synthase
MEQERIVLSHVTTPRGELQLQKRAARTQPIYEIIFNGVFLMASYNRLSEMKLATLALEPLASYARGLKVLIGGLGIGYTLRAALDWSGVHAVDVVEIEPHIITWAQDLFGPLNGCACTDPRVRLIPMDVGAYVVETDKSYDAIILDVDNGPTWLALEANHRLYEKPALTRFKELLDDGGVFTVWAAETCTAFRQRLEDIFGRTELITVPDTDRRGHATDYFIYRARSFGRSY